MARVGQVGKVDRLDGWTLDVERWTLDVGRWTGWRSDGLDGLGWLAGGFSTQSKRVEAVGVVGVKLELHIPFYPLI